jgi:hypothetical protein
VTVLEVILLLLLLLLLEEVLRHHLLLHAYAFWRVHVFVNLMMTVVIDNIVCSWRLDTWSILFGFRRVKRCFNPKNERFKVMKLKEKMKNSLNSPSFLLLFMIVAVAG